MSDEVQVDEWRTLLESTDAQLWAQTFMRVVESGAVVDEGLMIAWFANAFATAEQLERRQIAETIMGYPITIDVERIGEASRGEASRG